MASGSQAVQIAEFDDINNTNSDVVAKVAYGFIKLSLVDGEFESNALADNLERMDKSYRELLTDKQLSDKQREIILSQQEQLAQAVEHLQFFDRISQRMDHAARCLRVLSSVQLHSNLDEEFDPNDICHFFAMEDERILYQEIKQGHSLKEAVNKAYHHLMESKKDDESGIEFF